jgi:PAS domain S-box-containing protein
LAHEKQMPLTSAHIAHDLGDERIEVIADINSLIVWRAAADGTPQQPCGSVAEFLADKGPHDSEAWLHAVHADDRERVRPVWRHAIRSGTVFQAYYRLRQPDGSYRWSHGCGVPLLDDDGSVREWIGTIADIEDRITAERSPADGRIRLALAHNRVGVFDLDVASGAIWCSDTMAEIAGRVPNQPVSETEAWSLVHPDDRAAVRARIDAAATSGNLRWEAEFRLVDAVTGTVKWVDCSVKVLPDAIGMPERVVGTVRDVSARHNEP